MTGKPSVHSTTMEKLGVVIVLLIGIPMSCSYLCSDAVCDVTPEGSCEVSCHIGELQHVIPDGPLRNLPGTARNLSILVDNTILGDHPTVVLRWRPASDIHQQQYAIHLSTWHHGDSPRRGARHPHFYTVTLTDDAHIDQVELRVTSAVFSGMVDITAYVNTWVEDLDECHLRQAKTIFFAIGPPSSSHNWRYSEQLSLSPSGGVTVGIRPLPSATNHNLQLCIENPAHRSVRMTFGRCVTRIIPKEQNTTNFDIEVRSCTTYRLSIVPIPNPYNTMYRTRLFIPSLNCSVCEQTLSMQNPNMSYKQSQDSTLVGEGDRPEVHLSIMTVVLSVFASILGLGISLVFIALKVRHKKHVHRNEYKEILPDAPPNASRNAHIQQGFSKVKNVCLVCSEMTHKRRAVQNLCSQLTENNCDVSLSNGNATDHHYDVSLVISDTPNDLCGNEEELYVRLDDSRVQNHRRVPKDMEYFHIPNDFFKLVCAIHEHDSESQADMEFSWTSPKSYSEYDSTSSIDMELLIWNITRHYEISRQFEADEFSISPPMPYSGYDQLSTVSYELPESTGIPEFNMEHHNTEDTGIPEFNMELNDTEGTGIPEFNMELHNTVGTGKPEFNMELHNTEDTGIPEFNMERHITEGASIQEFKMELHSTEGASIPEFNMERHST